MFLLSAASRELGVVSYWVPGCAVTSGFPPGLPYEAEFSAWVISAVGAD